MERDSRPVPAGGGQWGEPSDPISPTAERVEITCSFCGQVFGVSRPKKGGRIKGEVQCSHCEKTGIVVYGRVGTRTLAPNRRQRERRSGVDRRQT
jgi:hypothetical protein